MDESNAKQESNPAPETVDFFAHPERWPFRYDDGTTGAHVLRRRGLEHRFVLSTDPDVGELAAAGWEPD